MKNKFKLKFSRRVFGVCLIISVSLAQPASAGVLFRNKNQVIRTTRPNFQQQQYNVRKSTAVMRATAPRLEARGGFGGVQDQVQLIKARYKYQVDLAKWENKRDQQIAKQIKKRKQNAEREAKRKQREAERLRKKQEREQQKIQAANQNQQLASSGQAQGSSSRGSLGSFNSQNQGKKKGFWSSLMYALFGKKSDSK